MDDAAEHPVADVVGVRARGQRLGAGLVDAVGVVGRARHDPAVLVRRLVAARSDAALRPRAAAVGPTRVPDPNIDAAKIRAFFVDPTAARQGIGTALLERCEKEARRHGFRRTEMMATLPGVRLYEVCGYVAAARVHYPLSSGLSIEFVPMSKNLTG